MIKLVTGQQELFKDDLYEVISVEESLRLLNKEKILQCDSETLGRDAHVGKLLCFQIGTIDKELQVVIDCTTVSILAYKNLLENKFLIFQNAAFDLQWLYNYGIVPLHIYDTMIVEQLLYLSYPQGFVGISEEQMFAYKEITSSYDDWEHLKSEEKKNILYSRNEELADFLYNHTGVSLKALEWRYLHKEMDKTVRGQIQYLGLVPEVIEYAANDVVDLYDIMVLQLQALDAKDMRRAAKVECDFVPCLAYYEWCGVKLDIPRWQAKMQKDQEQRDTALEALNQFVVDLNNPKFIKTDNDLFEGFTKKCNINWQSTPQLVELLTYLGFNCKGIDKKTKEEKDSVEAKVLKGQKGINDEFLKIYFQYTEASKVCSTYGQQYINAVNPNTGRIHTEFRQLGTDTGRLACGSQKINTDLAKLKGLPQTKGKDTSTICAYPQVQNLPKDAETRACFISEPDNQYVSIDYNSEESRLLASLANDQAMLDVFNKGYDMHSMVAYMIYPNKIPRDIDIHSIKKDYHDLRQAAKGPEFTFAFLGNWNTLVQNYNMDPKEAQEIEENYKKGFWGATQYQNNCQKFVEKNGYIVICKETNHKVYWWDWKWWKKQQESFTREFWDEYRLYHKGTGDAAAKRVKEHFQAKSKWNKNSVNSTTQGLGAVIFKIFNRTFMEWIVSNGYFGKIKYCIPAHDEICIECPKELTDTVVPVLKKYMSDAGELFCHRLPMPAEEEVSDHWVH